MNLELRARNEIEIIEQDFENGFIDLKERNKRIADIERETRES